MVTTPLSSRFVHRFPNRLWLAFTLLACFILPFSSAKAALTASVDRSTIAKNDIIQLTIRSNKGPIEHTDFSALERNFSVINRQRSNQISIINGKQQAVYDLRLALFPIDAGSFTIPAFTSQGESSQPIRITVSYSPTDPGSKHEEVFLKTKLSKQEVYVQEPLLFTLQLFHSAGLSEARLTSLEVKNARIDDIGEQTKREQILNGVRYSVIEKQYSITPEKSGQISIPELTFTGRTSNRNLYGQPGRYVRTRSNAHQIEVLPKPSNYPADATWLPTPALTVSDSWSTDAPPLSVGESVTRTLTLSALNLDAAQLPDISLPAVTNLKMYPDQSRNENTVTASGMLGQRIFSTAIVATKAGEIEIPATKVVWWNTIEKKLEETLTPAKTLTVQASANAATQIIPASPQSAEMIQQTTTAQNNATGSGTNGIWPYLTAMFLLLWLATATLWWQSTRRAPKKPAEYPSEPKDQNARSAYKAFKKACKDNEAATARQALLDWFRRSHNKSGSQQLQDITQHYQDENLTALIRALESSLYGNGETSDTWHGTPLMEAFEVLVKSQQRQSKDRKHDSLKPLYPF